ncbi:MAG: ATP-binding cassette domain-containing protein, partial [Alphaproteobacteria bacterium]
MTQSPNLKILTQDLNLFYQGRQALFQINLSIFEKQVLSLIGPSGCGKSTFLRCLNRMNDKAEGIAIFGKILLDGEDIYLPTVDVV